MITSGEIKGVHHDQIVYAVGCAVEMYLDGGYSSVDVWERMQQLAGAMRGIWLVLLASGNVRHQLAENVSVFEDDCLAMASLLRRGMC